MIVWIYSVEKRLKGEVFVIQRLVVVATGPEQTSMWRRVSVARGAAVIVQATQENVIGKYQVHLQIFRSTETIGPISFQGSRASGGLDSCNDC